MSENNDITRLDVQRKVKPKIEDVIPLIIKEDTQKSALDFVAWFREKKMLPGWTGVHNAWSAKFKGKTICKISLGMDGQWYARLYLTSIKKYEDQIILEELKELIINKLVYCRPCKPPRKCAMRENKQFFGEEFKGLCYDFTCLGGLMVLFSNPDESAINNIKILLEMEREVRAKK